ncbi:MAG: hypothetical protein ABEJ03_03465 [Candidatus Nanohaloarchaea archaeon]
MDEQGRRLAIHLLAVNLVGLASGTAFYLVDGTLAGIAGFMLGLFTSAFLVKKKTSSTKNAGVFEDLKDSRKNLKN